MLYGVVDKWLSRCRYLIDCHWQVAPPLPMLRCGFAAAVDSISDWYVALPLASSTVASPRLEALRVARPLALMKKSRSTSFSARCPAARLLFESHGADLRHLLGALRRPGSRLGVRAHLPRVLHRGSRGGEGVCRFQGRVCVRPRLGVRQVRALGYRQNFEGAVKSPSWDGQNSDGPPKMWPSATCGGGPSEI